MLFNAYDFAMGYWIEVNSSWVEAIKYDSLTHQLTVRFKKGVQCRYNNIDPFLAEQFLDAPSKGVFVHQHLINLPYTIV